MYFFVRFISKFGQDCVYLVSLFRFCSRNMASVASKVCKVCCEPMGVSDDHDTCLACLGLGHDMYACSICTAMEAGPRETRRSLVSIATRMGLFPDNWRQRLYPEVVSSPVVVPSQGERQEVPVVLVPSVNEPGPSVSVEAQPPTASQKPTKKAAKKRSASVLSASSLSAEEATDPVLLQILQNYREKKMSVGSLSIHSLDSQENPKPKKRAVRKSKAKQASVQPVSEAPAPQEVPVQQVVQAVPDFAQLLQEVVPEAPVPPAPLEPVPPSPPVSVSKSVEGRLTSLEAFMLSMQQTMGQMNQSLLKVSQQLDRPAPVPTPAPIPQPVVQPQVLQSVPVVPAATDSFRKDDRGSDDDAPYSNAELVTLKAKRQVWLSTLREIAPELPHSSVPDSGPSSCLIGLSRQQQDMPTPLLPEVVKGILDRSKAVKPGSRFKSPFKWVPKTISCGQDADKSLFQQRSVPRRLAAEVPSSSLDNPGTSGIDVKLKKGTKEGTLDLAARTSFQQAATYIMVANSQELAIHGLKNLLDRLALRIDLAMGENLPDNLQGLLMSVQDTLNTSQLAVSQLQTGNLNLSRCAMDQYVHAIRDRQQAWLGATSLPEALKKQLGSMDLATPVVQEEPLSVLGAKAEELLEEYAKNRKEDAYRMMLFGRQSASQPRAAKSKPAAASTSFAQSSAKFHPPAFHQGRGKPQNRGRGQARFRGRGKGRASAAKGSASASRP